MLREPGGKKKERKCLARLDNEWNGLEVVGASGKRGMGFTRRGRERREKRKQIPLATMIREYKHSLFTTLVVPLNATMGIRDRRPEADFRHASCSQAPFHHQRTESLIMILPNPRKRCMGAPTCPGCCPWALGNKGREGETLQRFKHIRQRRCHTRFALRLMISRLWVLVDRALNKKVEG